jgi:hypothetical protein
MSCFWLALGLAGFLFGGFIGGWLTARFYDGQLESLRLEQMRCSDAGKALESKLALQNAQVKALAARQRADSAERALAQAREQAQSHEAAASRLLLERSEGEECDVVRQLIDRELLP